MIQVLKGKNFTTKERVAEIVKKYIQDYPVEFDIVSRGIDMKRKMTRNEFASLEGSKEMRALYELPEQLSTMFVMNLSEEEMVWFKTKEGAHWFTRKFPVFALPQYV